MIDKEKVYQEALGDLHRLVGHTITLHLSLSDAMVVCAHIQLALRHPGAARTDSSPAARRLRDELIRRFEMVSPKVAALLRLGDDPQYDVVP